ncbi:ERMES complex subunit mmm1 [Dimargaris verticillata]|uniref:Maintenance of mitochondrial morphology protein 1 n=1 Tax=Dimargaris verticillata TaxID=2761393 RepID=A0A9W8B0M3_9FUNG|nr:ERMES complex subunit mmm1 [Dimargaris verticillata]
MDRDYGFYYASFQFAQGFVLGQVFVLVILFAIIRYVLFDDGQSNSTASVTSTGPDARLGRPLRTFSLRQSLSWLDAYRDRFTTASSNPSFREASRAQSSSDSTRAHPLASQTITSIPCNDSLATVAPLDVKQLFAQIGCDYNEATVESCQWVNLLIAYVLTKYRANLDLQRQWQQRLMRWINDPSVRPSFLADVVLTTLDLGTQLPTLHQVKVVPSLTFNSTQWHFAVSHRDILTLGIDTKIVVNWPKPSLAALPVSLLVSVVQFTGTITVELLQHHATPSVAIAVLPDYTLELGVQSLLGHRAKVPNLPKVRELIISRIQAAFRRHVVAPAFQVVDLPTFTGVRQPRPSTKRQPMSTSSKSNIRPRPTQYRWRDD